MHLRPFSERLAAIAPEVAELQDIVLLLAKPQRDIARAKRRQAIDLDGQPPQQRGLAHAARADQNLLAASAVVPDRLQPAHQRSERFAAGDELSDEIIVVQSLLIVERESLGQAHRTKTLG
nr:MULTISPECIES: hypothetical protein [unclassified Bradyrhizobium]